VRDEKIRSQKAEGNRTDVLSLRSTSDGVVVPIRVILRSSRTQIDEIRDGRLLVRLKQPPVDGAANKALIRLLATDLSVPRRAVQIVAGERARHKSILIEGLTAEKLLDRLTKLREFFPSSRS
jgi:uncharacterized protein (TIGR00251 family)